MTKLEKSSITRKVYKNKEVLSQNHLTYTNPQIAKEDPIG